MGDEPKIDVQNGGTVYVGQPFKWKNAGSNKVTASNLAAVCTDSSYEVPPSSGGKEGTKDAMVLATATTGPHQYTVSDGIKQTSPSLTVNSSVPGGKR